MFKKLSDHLKAKYSRHDEFSRQLQIVKVFDVYRSEIKKKFPNEQEIKPVSLKSNVLTIEVPSPVMANELRFLERQIVEKINQTLGREVVKRVVYRF